MQTCQNCTSAQYDGTIFCSECGADLTAVSYNGHHTHPKNIRHSVHHELPDQLPDPLTLPDEDTHLCLIVVEHGAHVRVMPGVELLLGRQDRVTRTTPDIDLTPYGANYTGVSRYHALISCRTGQYMLEDLKSSNGTFLNGSQVRPHRSVLLNGDDRLIPGNLSLRVEMCQNADCACS